MTTNRGAYFLLAILGLALILNLYLPVYQPGSGWFWTGIINGMILGITASLLTSGLFLAGWRRALLPGEKLWPSMNLTKKGLIAFCFIGLLRGVLPLVLIPIPGAGWVMAGILFLQIAGSSTLVVMAVPVMLQVFGDTFAGAANQPLRDKICLALQVALFPVAAVALIIGMVEFFTMATESNPTLDLAQRVSMLVIGLLALAISLLRLRERKMKWGMVIGLALLAVGYSLYRLMVG